LSRQLRGHLSGHFLVYSYNNSSLIAIIEAEHNDNHHHHHHQRSKSHAYVGVQNHVHGVPVTHGLAWEALLEISDQVIDLHLSEEFRRVLLHLLGLRVGM
jgi:hypothetical protein